MELIIPFLLIAANVLLYVFGFYIGIKRKQPVSVYSILLTIQGIVLIMQLFRVGYVGGSDAMGNGMEQAFLLLTYIGVQSLLAMILLIVFIRKKARHK